MKIDPIAIERDSLPDVAQEALKPEAPSEQRLLLARAVVPLGPPELVGTLCYLLNDPSDTVSSAARTTIEGLPWGVLSSGISETTDPGVLDTIARERLDKEEALTLVLKNKQVSGETVAYMATRGKGGILEQIAANQVMLQQNPRIIEGLYYNSEARMGTVSSVLEFAVRNDIDLSHIPGYREIVESIFGAKPEELRPDQETPSPPIGTQEKPPAPTDTPEEEPGDFEQEIEEAAGTVIDEGDAEGFLDDEAFSMVLQAAAWEEGPDDDEEEEEDNTALWSKVGKMSVVQKVRLALLGNNFIRSLLIRDSRRVVYMAVLQSPKTSDKEIIAYAKDKALDDEIARTISRNRDWTKLYAVRLSLVQNPKTSPSVAMTFLRTLNPRDVRDLTHSHDVPGYVVAAAKRLMRQREDGRRQ